MPLNVDNKWHSIETPDVFRTLNSDEKGLSDVEAATRLQQYGPNELRDVKQVSPFLLLLEQFKNVLIIILVIAVVLSAVLGELTDAIVIFVIIMFAAGLGFIQEYRAERAIQALRKMAAPLASVIRNGEEQQIPASLLVPGDMILISTGDRIPADARIIQSHNFRTNEAPLTGESLPVDKSSEIVPADADVADRLNMIFAGTSAVYGRCMAMVVYTGEHTEFGKIAELLKEVREEKTPLQVNLDRMGKWIAAAALALCAILAVMGIIRGHPPLEMLIWGISLAVAAVPEALPAVVTISLAVGVSRMVKKHALIRKLPAVETLGCTTVICSDKTGTMTQDQMTLKKIWVNHRFISISGSGYKPAGTFVDESGAPVTTHHDDLVRYLTAAYLCTDAKLVQDNGQWKVSGDPTEGALVVAATKAELRLEQIRESNRRINEIPFTSESKRMITICSTESGPIAYSNGAAEVILRACDFIYYDGQERPITEVERSRLENIIVGLASDALRVIGTAYKRLPVAYEMASVPTSMVLIGFGGMIDPPRPEVRGAIKTCDMAGIKTVMITGDHRTTAVAIAKELGVLKHGKALDGSSIDDLTDKELAHEVMGVDVFARVAPKHKLRVVEALTSIGHVVAMTGDGINDAPALKKADIGVAMGIKGTDVTKEAADMILTDDNFASIVSAVEEGRAIFGNIKKYLVYLLSCNVGEILLMASVILFGTFMGIPPGMLPLIAIQILYVNLATDGLPALALAVDPHSRDIMQLKPRPRGQGIFEPRVLGYLLFAGLWSAMVPLIVFTWAINSGKSPVEAQCLCFVTLIVIQFFNAFSCRSLERSIFNLGVRTNKWLIAAVMWELFLLCLVVYMPALQGPFNTFSLSAQDWIISIISAATIIIGCEIYKFFFNRIEANQLNRVSRRQVNVQ